MHYQLKYTQAKLVQVIKNAIFDVAADIRQGSPTFGKWTGVHISDKNRHQIFIPEGFSHGFCVLSETADVIYKFTDFYAPDDEGGILWPMAYPLLSDKDSQYPCLADVPQERIPVYEDRK